MLRMGFHQRWVNLIISLVSSVSFLVMFSGIPLDEFQTSRGLQQGDLIYPYLFLLVVEGLSGLLKKVVIHRILVGFMWLPQLLL
jgi:hypothetical protein